MRGWVDPRASVDTGEEETFVLLPGIEPRSTGRPDRKTELPVTTVAVRLVLIKQFTGSTAVADFCERHEMSYVVNRLNS